MTNFNFISNTVKKNILITIIFVLHMFIQSVLWYFNNKSFNIMVFIALLVGFDYITGFPLVNSELIKLGIRVK
jgi:hypothetical protein